MNCSYLLICPDKQYIFVDKNIALLKLVEYSYMYDGIILKLLCILNNTSTIIQEYIFNKTNKVIKDGLYNKVNIDNIYKYTFNMLVNKPNLNSSNNNNNNKNNNNNNEINKKLDKEIDKKLDGELDKELELELELEKDLQINRDMEDLQINRDMEDLQIKRDAKLKIIEEKAYLFKKKEKEYFEKKNKLEEEKQKLLKMKEEKEEQKNIFLADKKAYFNIKKDIGLGKINEDELGYYFQDKYPLFKKMEDEDIIEYDDYSDDDIINMQITNFQKRVKKQDELELLDKYNEDKKMYFGVKEQLENNRIDIEMIPDKFKIKYDIYAKMNSDELLSINEGSMDEFYAFLILYGKNNNSNSNSEYSYSESDHDIENMVAMTSTQ
jgi:hypothetical protein